MENLMPGSKTVTMWKMIPLTCWTAQSLSLLVHSNWETGASEMHDRARDWSEQSRWPRVCASRSSQSLNNCAREKRGTACSLLTCGQFASSAGGLRGQARWWQHRQNPAEAHHERAPAGVVPGWQCAQQDGPAQVDATPSHSPPPPDSPPYTPTPPPHI